MTCLFTPLRRQPAVLAQELADGRQGRQVQVDELKTELEVVAAENAITDRGTAGENLRLAVEEQLERYLARLAHRQLVPQRQRDAGGADVERTARQGRRAIDHHHRLGPYDFTAGLPLIC